MAPPAKPNITGRKVEEAEPKPKPNRMPATSSKAIKMEMKKVRAAETPAIIKGAIITIPSGMFCRAIPKETPHSVAPSAEQTLTPAAIPSGSLCKAIAIRRLALSVPAWKPPA